MVERSHLTNGENPVDRSRGRPRAAEADVFDRSDIDLLIERSMAGSGLLDELACGMCSSDESLAWDCAELLRRVAQSTRSS